MKQISPKILFYPMIFLLLFSIYQYGSATTIYSTTNGGNWSGANTWVDGVVPASSDDVILNGNVNVNNNVYCNNLTVSSGVVLQNTNNSFPHLRKGVQAKKPFPYHPVRKDGTD